MPVRRPGGSSLPPAGAALACLAGAFEAGWQSRGLTLTLVFLGLAAIFSLLALIEIRRHAPLRAFRILPRGTWQVRQRVAWYTIRPTGCWRTARWLTLSATFDAPDCTAHRRIVFTLWRHKMRPSQWRDVCVAVPAYRPLSIALDAKEAA